MTDLEPCPGDGCTAKYHRSAIGQLDACPECETIIHPCPVCEAIVDVIAVVDPHRRGHCPDCRTDTEVLHAVARGHVDVDELVDSYGPGYELPALDSREADTEGTA